MNWSLLGQHQKRMSLSSNRTFFKNFQLVPIKDSAIAGFLGSEVVFFSINLTGSRLVNSRTDKSLRIWKCTPERVVDPLVIEHAHGKAVELIAWNPKAEFTFASVGKDEVVKIWKCSGVLEKEVRVTKGDGRNRVLCQLVSYSADGEVLAVVDRDSTVILYSVGQNYTKMSETRLEDHIYDLQWFNYQHSNFLCTLHNGSVVICLVRDQANDTKPSLELKHTLSGHRSSATCACIDPRGKYFAIGSNEGVVSLWNTSTMLCKKVIANTDEPISTISISRDGTYIAVAYDTGSNVRVFDYESAEQVYEASNSLPGKLARPTVAWFPSKTAFIYTSDSGKFMTLMKKPDK